MNSLDIEVACFIQIHECRKSYLFSLVWIWEWDEHERGVVDFFFVIKCIALCMVGLWLSHKSINSIMKILKSKFCALIHSFTLNFFFLCITRLIFFIPFCVHALFFIQDISSTKDGSWLFLLRYPKTKPFVSTWLYFLPLNACYLLLSLDKSFFCTASTLFPFAANVTS